MRYIRQPDSYSCGPTAILNAMKWAGIDATSQYLPYLQFSCRTIDLETPADPESHGTLSSDFDRVLRYVGTGAFHVRRKKNPTASEMKRHLEKGNAIALAYYWEDETEKGEHFCFIAGLERGLFVCINDHSRPDTIRLRHMKTIKSWLTKHNDCPMAWFLTAEK